LRGQGHFEVSASSGTSEENNSTEERREMSGRAMNGCDIASAGASTSPEATTKPLAQQPSPICKDVQSSEFCKKVLIVDDEPDHTDILKVLFELEGFKVAVAVNGHDAVTQIHKVRPQVIGTDYMMPCMNGGEMAKTVRTFPQFATLPIVMMSATEISQLEMYLPYYDAFLRKPCLWEELISTTWRVMTSSRSDQT
jgi:CheY-like chemotaxis protein